MQNKLYKKKGYKYRFKEFFFFFMDIFSDPLDINTVLLRIQNLTDTKGTTKTTLAKVLGYSGKQTTQITSVKNILTGKKEILVTQLQNLSEFYRYPIGYFFDGNDDSPYKTLTEESIRQKIIVLFEEEQQKPLKQRKAKYKLGAYLGYAQDPTSQLNTVNRTLSGKRKIRVKDILTFIQFFERPFDFFLLP